MSATPEHPAITYFRRHPRVVTALIESGLFSWRGSCDSAMATTLLEREEMKDIEERISAFNLFEAIGVTEAEIRHSRFLGWLFNPQGSHGLGDGPLWALRQAFESAGGEPWPGKREEWQELDIDVEKGRVDVMIGNGQLQCAVVIENKIHAGERRGQLAGYLSSLAKERPGWTCRPIFLTLRGDEPSDSAYTAVSYRQWSREFASGTTPTDAEANLARSLLMRDYVELIKNGPSKLGPSNIFQVLHLAKTELKHSHFISWLLNPRAEHGWGTAFVDFLFELLTDRGLEHPTGNMPGGWEDIVVYREREHVDVLVVSERHRVALAIENKIGSTESADQLEDYARFLERHYKGDRLIKVFLDFKGGQASRKDYLSLSYQDLLPFFQERRDKLPQLPSESTARTRLLVHHYFQLLENKLWIRPKTRTELPGELQAACQRLKAQAGHEIDGMLGVVRKWQKGMGQRLEPFLYAQVDELFGSCYHFTHQVWYSFVPPEFDQIPSLRREGADPAFDGRAVMYQFFVIPFEDKISVRKAGIVIDVKILKVSPAFHSTKDRLLRSATSVPEFNRVKKWKNAPKFAPLLNYELISGSEAISCNEEEIKRRIHHRLRRFHDSLHPIIVEFFQRELDGDK